MLKLYSLFFIFLFSNLPANAMQSLYRGGIAFAASMRNNRKLKAHQDTKKSLFCAPSSVTQTSLPTGLQSHSFNWIIHPQTRVRQYSWFSRKTMEQRRQEVVKTINGYLSACNGSLLAVDENTYNSILKSLGTIDATFCTDPLNKELIFKLIAATGFADNPVIAPWFYNDKDIEQAMVVGIDRQKRLMHVVLNTKIDLNCLIKDANQQEITLWQQAVKTLNVGVLQTLVANKLITPDNKQQAINTLSYEFARLADKKQWLKAQGFDGLEYDRAKDFIVRTCIEIVQPGLSKKFTYTGPTSDNTIKSQKNEPRQTNPQQDKAANQKSHAMYLHDFYQLAIGSIKPSPERVLGVSALSSEQEIKQAYKALMQKYHPDKQCEEESRSKATVVAQLINTAYATLLHKK